MSKRLLALALLLSIGPLGACADDASPGGGGLLVPDQAEERRFGDVGEAQGATQEGSQEAPIGPIDPADGPRQPDPSDPVLTTPPGHSGSTTQCGGAVETEAFRLLNADRQKQGLQALQCDDDLLIVARLHCKDMHERGFFDHTNPDGERPWDRMNRYGITGWSLVGENIAAGQRSPAEVQTAWMNSPGHRANILGRDYTHLGVGVFDDGGTLYWTQVFARF